MQEPSRRPMTVKSMGNNGIDFAAPHLVEVPVQNQGFFQIRFFEFQIHLTTHSLKAIHHRSRSLGQLNFIDPSPRNQRETGMGTQTPHGGDVFAQHLNVGTGQSQELNLLDPAGRIRVRNLHRWIGFKTFG